MQSNRYYIKGFTFIEMVITIIISAIGTGAMISVFNAAQTRYFNDTMEASIDVYCHDAADFIASIVSRSDSTITRSGVNPPKYTIWKFNDKYINQGRDERALKQRKITVEMNDKGGVVIRENNTDITGELYNKYMLRNHKKNSKGHYEASNREWNALAAQGSFNPGKKFQDGDQNLNTQYVVHDFKIKQMDPGNTETTFFHNIVDDRIRNPLEECTYDIEITIQIQNKIDENSISDEFYTYRTYKKRAYCPSCFVRQRVRGAGKNTNI
ncbi:MAG: hypothetical protein CMG66_03305 [Candidatus Marinimicrobia bacterium]|nr:hypothetical protein [Candidatus Neomarinimicrobiota bacterium]|tara:strand:+ start:24987 stop:25790 length:804 start_codon:yes stop_codon:yes gene_type:complete